MVENESEIEVRTLTGETFKVSISSNRTIGELKLLLKQIFPPANSASNFHLFLKGTKLSLESQISSNLISHGEFIVLIPFTKKDKQKVVDRGVSETNLRSFNKCSTSEFAESAWSDMMQDLSSLREQVIDGNESLPPDETVNTDSNMQHEENRRNCESMFDEAMLNTLLSCDDEEMDGMSREMFVEVLETVNYLSDLKTKSCMLRNANIRSCESTHAADSSYSCICPSWLKVSLKAFYFLNIYCTLFQVQQKKVTVLSLKGGLNQLHKLGFGVEYADLEKLSLLFPKVIGCIIELTTK